VRENPRARRLVSEPTGRPSEFVGPTAFAGVRGRLGLIAMTAKLALEERGLNNEDQLWTPPENDTRPK
jgi:hypothetical protein